MNNSQLNKEHPKLQNDPDVFFDIGVALSGGSAKGFAHLGVLEYLEEHDMRPDVMSGTSMGSMMAALYCDGYSPKEIIEIFRGVNFTKMTEWLIPKGGIFGTKGFRQFLASVLRHKRIEELKIPLTIVATDLDHGCSKYFQEGDLVDVITASCSIPVLFKPVEIEGTYYVDGGLFKNLPASVIRNRCKALIGVHVDPKESKEYKKNIFSIAERSFNYIFRANSIPDRKLCDVLIESALLSNVSRFDIDKAPRIAALGYNMARKSLSGIDRTILLSMGRAEKHIFSAPE